VADLADAGLLPSNRAREAEAVAARYAVAVTPAIAELINRHDAADPIAKQFLPDGRELNRLPHELADPISDKPKSPLPGLVHRYPDRVLLKLVGVCAVYCRFCFRREMVGPEHGSSLTQSEYAAALDYIRAHPEIWEVILTGGDPLVISPRRVAEVTAALDAIPHVKVIRWHTRLPVVAPERVTDELIAALQSEKGKAVYIGLHANHPRELTAAARSACSRIIDAGIAMVSQTVLLRGVNADADTLASLMRGFVECRIKPYYLHHGDLAPGTSHFRVSIAEGQAIMAELHRRLSGLARPSYVLDIPGGHGKVPIGPGYMEAGEPVRIKDAAGHWHDYEDSCASPGADG